MKRVLVSALVLLIVTGCSEPAPSPGEGPSDHLQVELPDVRLTSDVPLEETLAQRRSIREYSDEPLALEDVSQLLWAAQGITAAPGKRTAPSAGALYPLEVYVVAGNVEGLDPAVYKYEPDGHRLVRVGDGDAREELAQASLGQASVRDGAVDIAIAAVFERTTRKYGDRGVRYVHMEAGHAAQNIYLQATALNLGTVTIGAFVDEEVKDIVGMSEDEAPLYVIPVGKKTW